MSLTHDQLELRRKAIGASESAAVLGLSPFEGPADVYYRKVGDVEPSKPNAAMEQGIRWEPTILDWAENLLGPLNRKVGTILHPSAPMAVTPDADVLAQPIAVEAKLTNIISFKQHWGEPGTDEIPDGYLVQAHHHMRVRPAILCVMFPVFVASDRGLEPHMYRVDRNEEVGAAIEGKVTAWWNEHVIARKPPEGGPPPLDFLKRLRRQPKSVVALGQQAVEALDVLEKCKALAKEAETKKEEAQAAVLAMLGVENPAEAATLPDGRQLTYYSQKSAPSIDMDMLRIKYPAAVAECVTQGTHRVLRVKKG